MRALSTLRIEKVSISFGGVHALKNVSLTVGSEEIKGLIGPNGAGKSTMINVIMGFCRPQGGSMALDGTDITESSPLRASRLGISRTFQNVELFGGLTVEENVLVGQSRKFTSGFFGTALHLPKTVREEKAMRRHAAETMDLLGLSGMARLRAIELPYGVQRKVEIARALAPEPGLLLLDEPAAGMSLEETNELKEVLHLVRSNRKLSILLVEHNMGLVMGVCDTVAVLDHGVKIADDLADVIARDSGVVEAYLGKRNA